MARSGEPAFETRDLEQESAADQAAVAILDRRPRKSGRHHSIPSPVPGETSLSGEFSTEIAAGPERTDLQSLARTCCEAEFRSRRRCSRSASQGLLGKPTVVA